MQWTRLGAWAVASAIAICLGTSMAIATQFGGVAHAGDGTTRIWSLYVAGTSGTGSVQTGEQNDAAHLRDAFATYGTNNWQTPQAVLVAPGKTALKDAITNAFASADDDDITLVFISAHGGHQPDTNGDEPEVAPKQDEGFTTGSDFVLDDDMNSVFGGMKGDKIIIFEACFSGGFRDGTSDLALARSSVLYSCAATERSKGDKGATFGHPHFYYPGYLVDALSNNGVDGYAKADSNKDGKITVKELSDDATTKTHAKNPAQQPGLDDSREPPEEKADKKTIFAYTQNNLRTAEIPGTGSTKDHCFEDIIGGIAEAPDVDASALGAAASGGSSPPYAAIAGAAMGLVVLGAVGRYARRRWRAG